MKRMYSLICLLTIFTQFIFPQSRKIDEFGSYNSEELQVRVEMFIEQIFTEPQSFGQILIFRREKDTFGFPYKIGAAITSFLTFRSSIEKSRIIITPCNAEKDRRIELWMVPKFEELRTCENESLNLTKTILFDSIYYDPEWGGCCSIDQFDEEEYDASLKAFATILKKNHNSKAYVFFYLGTNIYWTTDKRNKEKAVRTLDSPMLIKELVKTAKKVMSENGVESSRVILINGGYKDSTRNIELWYVPQNGEIPKPKPNYFPKKYSVKRKT